MRLHSLELTAFGSFRDHQRVDFDALTEAGLFLIVGATGAGKSTLLDAVTFALYGDVAGDRGRRGLRSDHAPAGVEPRVVLEVTVRGRRLRITRKPEWSRPKHRGEGTVKQNATVLVEQLGADDGWTALTTRLDEAGHLVTDLLGMSREQFCQVALLPQNAFARFLQAGSDERRDVLERLFAARVYTSAETWLAEHRTELHRRREEAGHAVTAVAERIAEAAGSSGTDRTDGTGEARSGADGIEELLPWTDGLLTRARSGLAGIAEAMARSAAELADRQDAMRRAGLLAERQRRHADYQRRADELDRAAGLRAGLAAELDAAGRAARVVPLLGAVHRHTETTARADAALGAARAAAVHAGLVDAGTSELDTTALTGAERARRDEASRLEAMRADADRLADLRTEIDQLDAEIDKRRTELATTELELAGFPAAEERLAAELLATGTRAAGLPAARAAVAAAEDLCRAVRDRDALAVTLGAAQSDLDTALDTAQDLRERWLAVKEARLAGMAAELAGRLVDGASCPVCGATEHPGPAVAAPGAPSEEDERAAERDHENARAGAEAARVRVGQLRGQLAALTETTGALDLADARAAVDARTAELTDARTADQDLPRLGMARQELATNGDRLRGRAGELSTGLAAAEARRRDRHADAVAVADRLDRARGTDPTVGHRIDRLSAEADLLAALGECVTALRAARAERDEAHRAARAEATDAGFDDLDQVEPACRDTEAVAALRAELARFDGEQATVRSGLDDPELRAAAAQPAPDLDACQAALDQARSAHESVLREESGLTHQVTRLASLRTELANAMATWRPVAHQYFVANRMAQLAQGTATDNRLRMRLSAYVLAARMEQVVAEANHRLDDMSGGRYLLSHTTDRRTGERGRGGLGLRVTDNWTGRDRDPATLSGGEKFYVSLALALGLMSVVTTEAGGVELDTLFVDEGFGALDEDTLDDVMAVLDALRDGGRAVGIVSHVADLRTRIPAQLVVTKTPSGSTVNHRTG